MAYSTYALYTSLYGNELTETEYNKLAYQASRSLDGYTTGIDGLRKLENYFPTEEYDANAVRMCECELIHMLKQINDVENEITNAHGYITRDDGTVVQKAVASVSSGSESISYSVKNLSGNAITAAAGDISAKDSLMRTTVRRELSGIKDSNGINLLYMGAYPNVS